MLSLLRTQTEQLKWTSKRKELMINSTQGMRGAPEPGAPAPATGHSPRILFPTAFSIGFSHFEVHLSRSVWVLGRDSTSAHVWYGLRTYLRYLIAGGVAGARENFGGLGAMLTNLPHLLQISVAQHVETASISAKSSKYPQGVARLGSEAIYR